MSVPTDGDLPIIVVDPGFMVDPAHSRTPKQPQNPDQPHKYSNKSGKTDICVAGGQNSLSSGSTPRMAS